VFLPLDIAALNQRGSLTHFILQIEVESLTVPQMVFKKYSELHLVQAHNCWRMNIIHALLEICATNFVPNALLELLIMVMLLALILIVVMAVHLVDQ
jgi:hypothetical protein